MKEIHFYLDNFSHLDHIFYTYDSTEEAIKQGRDRINTTYVYEGKGGREQWIIISI